MDQLRCKIKKRLPPDSLGESWGQAFFVKNTNEKLLKLANHQNYIKAVYILQCKVYNKEKEYVFK
jgi:hypothetical protein